MYASRQDCRTREVFTILNAPFTDATLYSGVARIFKWRPTWRT